MKKILKVAQACPVSMAKYETLHLTVVEEPELLQAIEATCAKMFGRPDIHPLYGAPSLIAVSTKADGAAGIVFQRHNWAHSMALPPRSFL